jgi:hypothetical protein
MLLPSTSIAVLHEIQYCNVCGAFNPPYPYAHFRNSCAVLHDLYHALDQRHAKSVLFSFFLHVYEPPFQILVADTHFAS